MARRSYVALLFTIVIVPLAIWLRPGRQSSLCRCYPGEPCWPSAGEWEALNVSISGNLLPIDPIGSVCHIDSASYNSEQCATLIARWSVPETHYSTPSSPMAAWWGNHSCSPFSPADSPCTNGPLAQYAANVTSAADVKEVLKFTKSHNIRLVIRNTGHDYLGRSTGAGGVNLWTHNLKFIETIPSYVSEGYNGPAMRIGAGVQGFEAQNAAHESGYVIVTGFCPDVGIAGGYTQGGGHGSLASRYGLAADQVLEWEVVTAGGEQLTASPTQNADLYWALSGGGGGTYAVVLSMTVRVYPEEKTSVASLSFTSGAGTDATDVEHFWSVIKTFIVDTQSLLDDGGAHLWFVLPTSLTGGPLMFMAGPITLPGGGSEELQFHLESTLLKLQEHEMPYQYTINDFPSYHAAVATQPVNISDVHVGGRLISRASIQSQPDHFISAAKGIVELDTAFSGYHMNVSRPRNAKDQGFYSNAANPAWQTTASSVVIGIPFSHTDRQLNIDGQKLMTDVLMPKIDALVLPGEVAGIYGNEADFNTPDWQTTFYGEHYDRLRAIKDKYDPDQIFYGRTGVGSDRWVEHADGRLCRL
ncbi:FAD binding domain protein [Penicillium longicatenatum]|uniref:FAD binding domain protein n=1 Tax=Penicillium longicatenatum TaxID=1561947 RepID=UPI002546D526|nr:FAD binding domain protein [Penicillium longicatenatum]KAJ5630610.1 FAD binding domain protein [Penicillium longicatenatum]